MGIAEWVARFDTFPSSMFTSPHQKAQYFEVDDPNVHAAPSLRGAFDGFGPNEGGRAQATQQLHPLPNQFGQPSPPTGPWGQR
jgi:hypothetical protein